MAIQIMRIKSSDSRCTRTLGALISFRRIECGKERIAFSYCSFQASYYNGAMTLFAFPLDNLGQEFLELLSASTLL